MLIEVAYLIVWACIAPTFEVCQRLEVYEIGDPVRCQILRPAAAGIWQLELDNTKEWTFTRCILEEEILIDNGWENPDG